MRSVVSIVAAGVVLLSSVALVARGRGSDPYSSRRVTTLLEAAPTRQPKDAPGAPSVWRALLEHPLVERTPEGLTFPLGRLQADPTVARSAALAAGELLALPTRNPDGTPGEPAWRVILASSAARTENGRRLVKLNGCRASALPDAAPALEDTYHARLSLAAALERLAREAGEPLELEGTETPVQGGANFELMLLDGRQFLALTFAEGPERSWTVEREFQASAPNDARARTTFVTALRDLAASDPSLPPLTVVGAEAPAAAGIDVRLEQLGGRLSLLTPGSQGLRLSAFIELEGRGAR